MPQIFSASFASAARRSFSFRNALQRSESTLHDDEHLLWRDAKAELGMNCNGDVCGAKFLKERFRVGGGADAARSFCSCDNARPPALHIVMPEKKVRLSWDPSSEP